MKNKKIRYAVAGLGHIAQTAVLPAFKAAQENSELAALISSDSEKLDFLGKKYHVKHLFSYEQYEECLNSGLIDAVYIATPNTYHRIFAQVAAENGIHVLTEKPMAADEYSCLSMLKSARENNVKLMVGYRLHFDPANLSAIELIKKGRIGNPRIFNSNFTMQVKDIHNIRLQSSLGGGPLFDIGIYCINAARYLFQDEPVEAFAMTTSTDDPRFREIDEMCSVSLRFPDSRLANFVISFGAASESSYEVIGSSGKILLENAYQYSEKMTLTLKAEGHKEKIKSFAPHDQFAPEILYFSDCILNDLQPEPSAEEGLLDVKIICALLASARINRPVLLDYFRKSTRPDMAQKIRKNLHAEPQTIHVSSPRGYA